MAPPAIEVEHVTKLFAIPHEQRTTVKEVFLHPLRRTTYEVNHALQDVSFAVKQGEFFGVIGPNGSGKSTLLKTIAGIYRPDAGRSDGPTGNSRRSSSWVWGSTPNSTPATTSS